MTRVAVVATLVLTSGWLLASFTWGDRRLFVPERSTAGHYQIESKCSVCHTPFGGVPSSKCLGCHAEELKMANDSHAPGKFSDPRNAHTLAVLDARECRSCHQEHRPAATHAGGVSLPAEHCFPCHADIGTQRVSHAGFAKDGCAAAGCHNYHDNTALYEDFIVRQLNQKETFEDGRVPERGCAAWRPVTAADSGANLELKGETLAEWKRTAHARAGVNCSGCHSKAEAEGRVWFTAVGVEQCGKCHEEEAKGFLEARHGMRLAQELSAIKPGVARQAMKSAAAHREMTCNACHGAHEFATRTAAVDACLNCHNDQHSVAYGESVHARLWEEELSGRGEAGSGVSCATCHLPREEARSEGKTIVQVQHNANANLRPNEKMIRTVCLKCHGFEFSASALADALLLQNNFVGRPAPTHESVKMVARRLTGMNEMKEAKEMER